MISEERHIHISSIYVPVYYVRKSVINAHKDVLRILGLIDNFIMYNRTIKLIFYMIKYISIKHIQNSYTT